MNLKKLLFTSSMIAGLALNSLVSTSQVVHLSDAKEKNTSWTEKPFDQKVFIENKGQFNGKNGNNSTTILFGASFDGLDLYFSSQGITYRHDDVIPIAEEEKETQAKTSANHPEKIENERRPGKSIPNYLAIGWLGANPKAQLVFEDPVSFYFTYNAGEKNKNTTIKANAFKKIIYKNLYPNIDVEYFFPADSTGIKYSVLLHPGANPKDIKMKYENTKNISLDSEGNVVVKSSFGNLIDHSPKSFYKNSGKPITTSFSLDNSIVSFAFPTYLLLGNGLMEDVIIDPWVVNPGFTADNKAYDIAKDAFGNIYVYGGGGTGSTWKLKKFDSSGNPIWTYTPPFDGWYGDLAVDLSGNSYISEGCGQVSTGIQKIDPAGTMSWDVDYGVYEFWCLAFNCSFTNLYVGCGYGGTVTPVNSIANVDLNTGTISGGTTMNSGGGEPRSIAWGPNGNIYFISCSGGNMVFGVTPTFTTIFSVPNGYSLLYNGPSYANGSNPTSGQNGIAANNRFVYTSDGSILNKRNVLDGTLISTITIPGGIVEGNSGVIIDDCGFVYAGSSNGVYKYDSLLTFISSVPTSGPVYCLYPGTGGDVLASGNGFIASLSLSYCVINSLTLNISTTGVSCNGPNSGTASVTVSGGSSPYTFSWSNGQTTQTATGLAAGTYTVTISDASGCKQSTATATVASGSNLTSTTSSTPSTCGNNNGSATINCSGGSSPYTYNWAPSGGTNPTATGLNSGTYTVTVSDAGGCTQSQTVIIAPSIAGPTATVSPNVTITQGQNTSLTATGGGTYSWTPSTGLSCNTCATPIATPSSTTNYCVTVSDINSCNDTACVRVTVIVENHCPTKNDDFTVPTAFSPNNDGHNDLFILPGMENCFATFSLMIFDRWGEKVFATENASKGWDGTFRSLPMNSAVFVYTINATLISGEKINKKGNISLIR